MSKDPTPDDVPDDVTDAAWKSIEDAEDHAVLAFRERLMRLAPALPAGAQAGLIPLSVVYNEETGGIRISIGSNVPLKIAQEALRMAADQTGDFISPQPN